MINVSSSCHMQLEQSLSFFSTPLTLNLFTSHVSLIHYYVLANVSLVKFNLTLSFISVNVEFSYFIFTPSFDMTIYNYKLVKVNWMLVSILIHIARPFLLSIRCNRIYIVAILYTLNADVDITGYAFISDNV